MKWERPELKSMNAMDSAYAGCSSGSQNSSAPGCMNGSMNTGVSPDTSVLSCSNGSMNSIPLGWQ